MSKGTGTSVSIPVEEIIGVYGAWIDEVCRAIANELVRETRKNARTAFDNRTRNLYRSIKRKKSKINKDQWLVGAFAPHAHLVESGHRLTVGKNGRVVGHVPPHPFFEPAIEAVKARLPQIVGEAAGVPTVTVEK